MAPQQVVEAFNAHLNKEFYASYLYLSMAAYCQSINLPGFARWLRLQSQEELSHAMKFFDFLDDRGARVQLAGLQQPTADFESPLRLFEQILAHEQAVTREIDQLYGLAGSVMPRHEAGHAMGVVSLGAGLFGYFGPQMLGILRDQTGSFAAGFYMVAVADVITLALIGVLYQMTRGETHT